MSQSLYQHVLAWCDGAADAVNQGKQALLEFDAQDQKAAPAFAAFIARAKQDPRQFDRGPIYRGAAAMLAAFEDLVFSRLSYDHYDSYGRLKEIAARVGTAAADHTAPGNADTLLTDYDVLASDLVNLSKAVSRANTNSVTSSWSEADRNRHLTDMENTRPPGVKELEGKPLPDLLTAALAMSAPAPSSANAFFYVPKSKRSGRLQGALWTLGILGLLSLIPGSGFIRLLFVGALAYFAASAFLTQKADADEEGEAAATKRRLRQIDMRMRELFQRTIEQMNIRLEDTANSANDLCLSAFELATSMEAKTPEAGDFVLGACFFSPLVGYWAIDEAKTTVGPNASRIAAEQLGGSFRKGWRPKFGDYASVKRLIVPKYGAHYDGVVRFVENATATAEFLPARWGVFSVYRDKTNLVKPGDFVRVEYKGEGDGGMPRLELKEAGTDQPLPFYVVGVNDFETRIENCLCHFSTAEIDRLEVISEVSGDANEIIARSLIASTIDSVVPGRARFMFIEPGRLAEAYRVFGSLNETPATRVADRLYVTHISEFAGAIDSLRTFIGRTKEAVMRSSDKARRITAAGDTNAIVLPRAVVVLDETETTLWPEKDRRRLAEYYDEIKALAEVGAREGSVLLLHFRNVKTSKDCVPETGERSIRMLVTRGGFLLDRDVRVQIPELSATSAAAKSDAWCKLAKSADSTLRQTGAKLDWSDAEASDTRYGIEAEIGRYGADRPARLVLGRDGAHHAICIGRTGSGKTNLFHVIVSNLVRRYSPEEIELYLLDFKEGVEFAVYADLALPHCRAVAIDADRGFGLSVLSHLRRELNRRANVFKGAGIGITSLERYEEATGKNMPRIVLLIDEFQVLLQGERTPGAGAGAAAAALEDLVRRGRSFGLHVILGSQTLAGRELTPATLGQLAVRIVLPCSGPDAVMLLGDQPISGQLRAPGDAIVWSAGQGNVSDAHLAKIFSANLGDLPELAETSRRHVEAAGGIAPAPFVFRGSGQNALTEVMPHLRAARAEDPDTGAALFSLGAPTAYGERAAGRFESRRSRNCLFVHRTDETRASFFYSALESLLELKQDCHFLLCDLDGSKDFEGGAMAQSALASFGDHMQILQPAALETEIARLIDDPIKPVNARVVLGINGGGRTNLVRLPAFAKLLREGPERGLHALITCDSVRNLERIIERPLLAEFGMRLLGPAAAGDSQRLIETSDAESVTADHQYLLLDDTNVGRLARLQVLTSTLELGVTPDVAKREVANA